MFICTVICDLSLFHTYIPFNKALINILKRRCFLLTVSVLILTIKLPSLLYKCIGVYFVGDYKGIKAALKVYKCIPHNECHKIKYPNMI